MLNLLRSLVLGAQVTAQDTSFAAAVRDSASRLPVEAVGNRSGFVTVRAVHLLDVDRDGRPEAFVWIEPQVRQTPYILVYARNPSGTPRLLLEGLAPGGLVPVSGRLIDDHTLGYGVDLLVGSSDSAGDFLDVLLNSAQSSGMTLVRYPSFYHADTRRGYVGFIDLNDRALPDPTSKTCENFEFSQVEGLAVGTLAGRSEGLFLVVLTSHEVTTYRFEGIRANGTLMKTAWVQKRPPTATGIGVSATGVVHLDSNGAQTPVGIPPR